MRKRADSLSGAGDVTVARLAFPIIVILIRRHSSPKAYMEGKGFSRM